jgi:hypothetical protein
MLNYMENTKKGSKYKMKKFGTSSDVSAFKLRITFQVFQRFG